MGFNPLSYNSAHKTKVLLKHIAGNKAKGRISKQAFQENKAHQIFRKKNISYPLIRTCACAYQGVRNVRFSENLVCFVFLKHPSRDSPFCLITDETYYSNFLAIRLGWLLTKMFNIHASYYRPNYHLRKRCFL